MAAIKGSMPLAFGKRKTRKKYCAGANGVGQLEMDALINTAHGSPSSMWSTL